MSAPTSRFWSKLGQLAITTALVVGCSAVPAPATPTPDQITAPATAPSVVQSTVTVALPTPSVTDLPATPTPNTSDTTETPIPTATAALAPASPTSAAAIATPAASARPQPLTAPLPRHIRFGGLDLMVTSGQISPLSPEGLPSSSSEFAQLSVTVTNLTKTTTPIYPGLAKLALGNGKQYVNSSLAVQSVPGSASVASSFVFPVPLGSTWDGSNLIVDQVPFEPAVLPLTGPIPSTIYPINLPSEGVATVSPLTYHLTGGTVDVNYGTQRVAAGKRFVILNLTVQHDGSSESQLVSDTSFRLLLNGQSLVPESAPIQWLPKNGSLSGDVVFVVPPTGAAAQLQVGKYITGPLAKISLDLSPIK